MPVYEYIALDAKGHKRKGIIDAGSVAVARQKLRETDVFPVDLKEAATRKKEEEASGKSLTSVFRKARLRDVSMMTRQLSTLLSAGLPLIPSLNAIVAQTRHQQLRTTLAQIREQVNEGNSLTNSLSSFPDIFPPFYVNMVRAGEASGTLDVILERLADFYENQQNIRNKVRSALAYPILMFLIGSGVLMFLVTFVVPNITKIFQEMHQTLPGITVFLILVSGFLKTYWWMALILVIAAIFSLRYAVTKTVQGKYWRDRIKLRLPVIGVINQKIAIARFGRTLGTLLKSDVPLLTSLEIVRSIVNNQLIADEISKASKAVEEGQGLSKSLTGNGLFPPTAIEMISVGEQSDTLETMLFRIADAYDKESEAGILMMTSLLEPVMILVMGLAVGFIVVSVLLPIFEMNQLVR